MPITPEVLDQILKDYEKPFGFLSLIIYFEDDAPMTH